MCGFDTVDCGFGLHFLVFSMALIVISHAHYCSEMPPLLYGSSICMGVHSNMSWLLFRCERFFWKRRVGSSMGMCFLWELWSLWPQLASLILFNRDYLPPNPSCQGIHFLVHALSNWHQNFHFDSSYLELGLPPFSINYVQSLYLDQWLGLEDLPFLKLWCRPFMAFSLFLSHLIAWIVAVMENTTFRWYDDHSI